MKTFTRYPSRFHLGLILKIIITTIWLLCIASAAWAAPILSQLPANQTVCSGTNPAFTISVTGTTGPVTIKWQERVNSSAAFVDITDGGSYSGATTVTLTLTNVTVGNFNGRGYQCVVTDATGTTISNIANLTVNQTPAVDPVAGSKFICVDARNSTKTAPFVAGASYQWQVSTNNGGTWANLSSGDGYLGSTTNTLTYPQIRLSMNGNLYRYRVTVGACSNTSIAVDTLHTALKPAWVASLPGDPFTEICPGDDISFADSATGVVPILYRWQIQPLGSNTYTDIVDNAVFSGSQGKILQITDFPGLEGSINFIRLKATYPAPYLACDVNTGASQLTVRTLPAVAVPPADVSACANSTALFSVSGSGSEQLNYQWETDNGTGGVTWTNVGTNSDQLPVNGVTPAMHGWRYRVTVSNACTPPAASTAVTLTVRRSGVWLGTTDTRWEEAQNWCGGVPDNTIDVLVPNFLPPNMPNISDATGTAFFRSLEIENEARLTISGGAVDNMIRASNLYNLAGTVAYTAPRNQEIFPANHGSLEIDGTGNKSLNSHVDVSRNLVLGGSAKLVTRTNILTMKAGSNSIVASSFNAPATSWIVTGDGSAGAGHTGLGGLRIEQIDAADGQVTFQVGPTPAAYNPLRLANTGTADNFTVAVNDQLIPGGIFNAGVNRTWLVSEAAAGNSNVTLALKWQGNEEHAAFDRALSQTIRSNGTQIVQASSRAAALGTNPYTSVDGAFSTLTQFSVASTVAVLPMAIKSFAAQKTGNAAVGINWNATDTDMSQYFNVQRSADGVRFVTIARVNAEAGKAVYNYIDNLPGTGTVYYRLQIAVQQNEMVYSGIQSVVLNSANLVQLRPSVATGITANVYMHLTSPSVVSLSITDISGRTYSRQSLQLNKGEHLLPIWTGGLTKGVYYVHVKDEKGNANVLTLVKN